jgi:hypothetical protein
VRALDRGREAGAYAELVALDWALFHWAMNPEELGVADVVSLALGARLRW